MFHTQKKQWNRGHTHKQRHTQQKTMNFCNKCTERVDTAQEKCDYNKSWLIAIQFVLPFYALYISISEECECIMYMDCVGYNWYFESLLNPFAPLFALICFSDVDSLRKICALFVDYFANAILFLFICLLFCEMASNSKLALEIINLRFI